MANSFNYALSCVPNRAPSPKAILACVALGFGAAVWSSESKAVSTCQDVIVPVTIGVDQVIDLNLDNLETSFTGSTCGPEKVSINGKSALIAPGGCGGATYSACIALYLSATESPGGIQNSTAIGHTYGSYEMVVDGGVDERFGLSARATVAFGSALTNVVFRNGGYLERTEAVGSKNGIRKAVRNRETTFFGYFGSYGSVSAQDNISVEMSSTANFQIDPISLTWRDYDDPNTPIADFNSNKRFAYPGQAIEFGDFSEGEITAWGWEFGDGSVANKRNPVHAYQAEGSYAVSLAVSGPNGSNTEVKEDFIVVTNSILTSEMMLLQSVDADHTELSLRSAIESSGSVVVNTIAADGDAIGYIVAGVVEPDNLRFRISGPQSGSLYELDPSTECLSCYSESEGKNTVAANFIEVGGSYFAVAAYKSPNVNFESISAEPVVSIELLQNDLVVDELSIDLALPPLLLLHGLWSDNSIWEPLISDLEARDVAVSKWLALNLPNSYSTLESIVQNRLVLGAEQLLRDAREDGYLAAQVDAVAHSMGNLIARTYASEGGMHPYRNPSNHGSGAFNRLFSLTGPLAGTGIANWIVERSNSTVDRQTNFPLLPETPLGFFVYTVVSPVLGTPFWEITLADVADFLGHPINNGAIDALSRNSPEVELQSTIPELQTWNLRAVLPPALEFIEEWIIGPQLLQTFDGRALPDQDRIDSPEILGDCHDGVVPFDSSVSSEAIENFTLTGATHNSVHKSQDVHDLIYCWITGDESACPSQPPIDSNCNSRASFADFGSVVLSDLEQLSDESIQVELTEGSSPIPSNLPSYLEVSSQDHTITRVIAFSGSESFDLAEEPFEFRVQPKGLNPIDVVVVALLDEGKYAVRGLALESREPGPAIALSVHESLVMTHGDTFKLSPRVTFDQLELPMTAPNGVNYFLANHAEGVLQVSSEGEIRANKVGKADVTTVYGPHFETTHVEVMPRGSSTRDWIFLSKFE